MMDRRAMISMVPSGVIAGLVAANAFQVTAPSRIDNLFDAWIQARQQWSEYPEESPEAEAMWSTMTALERDMIEAPARSASDLAKTLYAYFSEEMGDRIIDAKIAKLAGMA